MKKTGFTGHIVLASLTLSATSHARARNFSVVMRDLSLLVVHGQ